MIKVEKMPNGAIVAIHYNDKGKEVRREILVRLVYASKEIEDAVLDFARKIGGHSDDPLPEIKEEEIKPIQIKPQKKKVRKDLN
jgi:hypothetical protein